MTGWADSSPGAPTPLLRIEGLSKGFGGTQALDRAELAVMPGEVHGLLGENGSGKSTLIKVLAGVHPPDAGSLRLAGREIPLPLRPGDGRRLGISFVHQDLGLVNSLTVLDNMRLGDFAVGAGGRRWHISWRRERRELEATFERYGLDVRPETPVSALTPLERALIAIVRAVEGLPADRAGARSGLLVLDEPTVFLPRNEVEALFGLIRTIRDAGGSVLFVSHDLDEVREITDRITVLRDGRTVGTAATESTSPERLVEMIVGHRLAGAAKAAEPGDSGARAIRVEGLRGPRVRGVSFDLDAGEVLGLTGLLGSGFESVPYLLFDDLPGVEGSLRIGDRAYDAGTLTPHRSLEAGIALLPGDRREAGVASLTLTDNLMLPVLDEYGRGGVLQRSAMKRRTQELLADCGVRPADPAAKFASLSGGNQQKALLAKWLGGNMRLLLVDEPTQGVDIGAREQITDLLRQRAGAGTPIVCSGSDYEQLALLCDRVLVLGEGQIVDELRGDQVSKECITDSCLRSVGTSG